MNDGYIEVVENGKSEGSNVGRAVGFKVGFVNDVDDGWNAGSVVGKKDFFEGMTEGLLNGVPVGNDENMRLNDGTILAGFNEGTGVDKNNEGDCVGDPMKLCPV